MGYMIPSREGTGRRVVFKTQNGKEPGIFLEIEGGSQRMRAGTNNFEAEIDHCASKSIMSAIRS